MGAGWRGRIGLGKTLQVSCRFIRMEYRAIGEVAAEVGVSPQTLRVWEEKGLLSPARSTGGHRLYGPAAVGRARQIARLRQERGWNPAAIATALPAGSEE